MSIFRLEPSSPDFIFILLYYYIISLLTSARTRDAEHVIILLYRRTAHTHTQYTRVLYTDTFLLQIQPMHLRGVPIVCTVPGSHEKPVWGPEG